MWTFYLYKIYLIIRSAAPSLKEPEETAKTVQSPAPPVISAKAQEVMMSHLEETIVSLKEETGYYKEHFSWDYIKGMRNKPAGYLCLHQFSKM